MEWKASVARRRTLPPSDPLHHHGDSMALVLPPYVPQRHWDEKNRHRSSRRRQLSKGDWNDRASTVGNEM